MKLYILITMFILIGALFIISENHLSLSKSNDRTEFSSLYFNWLSQIWNNTRQVTGYLIKMDWLPKNETASG